ncbi:Alpha/beta hydrolase [Halomicronema hongdechloris C2206]|uniref:Alpha/beta hydrolase n=1 Tax=Halomicronema hongdechloris C2206 TaxID=1641165 RepID=A0A1Z3HN98_9CYAN|nr:alpha/beta hydrolase [Halomicronema hongdechloris]ASC71794.1 Alpha/beta hydrolase [Halomicronema hongdechloris C2206]
MRLHTTVAGSGYPILCLHGHPGNGRSLSVFTDVFSRRFQTIAPDLRGYGQSRSRYPFQMSDHLSDLVALLDERAIDQCLVLGWSLGGILALELALAQPERIRGLILVATAARPRSSHPAITWQDLLYTGLSTGLNWLRPGCDWAIQTGRRSLYRYLLRHHTQAVYRRLAGEGVPAYLKTSRGARQALSQALVQGYDRSSVLDSLTMPCLMLCGREDRHITAMASQETAKYLANCQLHSYSNVAHLFPWEIPTQVTGDIQTWLRQTFPDLYIATAQS